MKTKNSIILITVSLLLLVYRVGAQGPTFVTAPLSSPNTAGVFYSNTAVVLSPGFSTAPGVTFQAYIETGDCAAIIINPTVTQNYILTTIPRISGVTSFTQLQNRSTCDIMQTIQYMDGIGRPLQTIQVKGSAGFNDVVQPFSYDAYNREAAKYLPYTTSVNDGSYKADALTNGAGQSLFYTTPPSGVAGTPNPLAQSAFEPSPLNRVIEQGAPGNAWQLSGSGVSGSGHTLKIVYTNNNQTAFSSTYTAGSPNPGSRQVALYGATINSDGSRTLTRAGNNAMYATSQLSVTITADENAAIVGDCLNTTEDYKDILGRTVLKRTYDLKNGAVEMLSTYYIYDDKGNLCFVLPPGANPDATAAISQATLDNFCYQYYYDGRDRLTQKKVPGKGLEYLVYNALDQVVLSQDANQRTSNQWTVNKYDGLGRTIVSGLWNAGSAISQSTLQTSIYGGTQFDGVDYTNNTTTNPNGYVMSSYPALSSTLAVNYYDGYNHIPGLPLQYSAPAGATTNTTGLATATLTNILGTSNMLWTAHYYDGLGRALQSYAQHNQGGGTPNAGNYDVIANAYDFTNAVTNSTRTHYNIAISTTAPSLTIANTYVYDHTGRKKQSFEQINGGTIVLLSQVDYNEVGQVMTKHLHSTNSGTNFLQDNAYTYNERGWLTKSSAPLFEEQLQYNNVTGISGISPTAQFNGNIASQSWGTAASPNVNSYTYNYDVLNRLTAGTNNSGYSETGITYDSMGNMLTLVRSGGANGVSLNYDGYSGNQLTSVKNNGTQFRSYAYDPNGNATSDGQGNAIGYNLLNLPATIPGKSLTYIYDAEGSKLRKLSGTNATDYISGIQYDNGSITFVQTEEGRVLNPTGTPNYEYSLTDHLGNSRVNFDSSHGGSTATQTDDYYPFGLAIQPSVTSPPNNYLYNKKELQAELTQYDYGARLYDPVVGRFTITDPHAENYYDLSQYNYAADNPITNVDFDGKDIINQLTTHKSRYNTIVNNLRSSAIFNKIYSAFERSTRHYYIFEGEMEDAVSSADAEYDSSPRYNSYSLGLTSSFPFIMKSTSNFDGRIKINSSISNLDGADVYEEAFHGYQALYYGVNDNGGTKANIVQEETEARVARFYDKQYNLGDQEYYGDYINDENVINYYSALRKNDKKSIEKFSSGFRRAVLKLAEETADLYINSTNDIARKKQLKSAKQKYTNGATPVFDSLVKK